LNENIADSGGIKAAYYAYKASTGKTPEEPILPGLNHFTSDQLFFISYAQVKRYLSWFFLFVLN